jgi:hypothetical protein
MWNRFPCVCQSWVGGGLIWNQLSRDQLISTHSIPSRRFSEVLYPQIAPLSHLLIPKLSTFIDCCLGWVVQHLQAFCMSLATHCHHIVVVPSLSSNCRCPTFVLNTPLLLPSQLPLPSPSQLPLPLPFAITVAIAIAVAIAVAIAIANAVITIPPLFAPFVC